MIEVRVECARWRVHTEYS